MPYTNIVFVKFKLELLKDYRFTDKLNDSQKLVFLSLLLLAGMTDNKIPHDTSYIKRILNLDMSPDTIEEGIKQIMAHYPKLLSDKGVISFTKFEEIHNYKIGKPEIEKGVEQNKKKNKEEEKEEDKKHKHLDFVFLTKKEYALLEERFKSNLPAKIESLNNYIGSKGKKYKSHYHTLLNWARMEEKPQPKQRCDF